MLAHIISRGFPHLEVNYIYEVLHSNTAKLTEVGLEHITTFCEPEDGDSDTVVERSANYLKKGSQMADDLVIHC
jgi:hypothetical protein